MKKYYLSAIVILLIGLFAYHFIAESKAEQQLDESLKELNQKPKYDWSLQYSTIEVSAFAGDIRFSDITFIEDKTIFRSEDINFDLGYLDFLRIYLGGLQFGLEYLDEATVTLRAPVTVDRTSLREVKFKRMNLSYSGNAWDLLQNLNGNTPLEYMHQIDLYSPGITLSFPETTFSQLKAASFRYQGKMEAGSHLLLAASHHRLEMDSLSWTPSKAFQNTYGFFIRGFGYPTDAIPFESARLFAEPVADSSLVRIEATVDSELAQLTGAGYIRPETQLLNSEWQDMELKLDNLSESFSTVLVNLEQLLGVSLPGRDEGSITFEVDGMLSNTSFRLKK